MHQSSAPVDGAEGSNDQVSFEDASAWAEPMVLGEPDETVASNFKPDGSCGSCYSLPTDFDPHYVWASEPGTSPSSSVSADMGNVGYKTADPNLVRQAIIDSPQQEFPLASLGALDPTVHGQPFQDDEPLNREASISFGDIVNLDMFS